MFGSMHYKFRIRRYLPCCADEAVQTSWLRKLTEADLKNNNRESGGSNCGKYKTPIKPSKHTASQKMCSTLVNNVCSFFVRLSHLQVFVRCDPVPSYSQHTNYVMFVWKKCRLFWLLLLSEVNLKHMSGIQCWYIKNTIVISISINQYLQSQQ